MQDLGGRLNGLEKEDYHPFYNKVHAALTKGVLEGQNEKDV